MADHDKGDERRQTEDGARDAESLVRPRHKVLESTSNRPAFREIVEEMSDESKHIYAKGTDIEKYREYKEKILHWRRTE